MDKGNKAMSIQPVTRITLADTKRMFPPKQVEKKGMKIIVTPDNEIEVWNDNKKVGYVDESGALFAIVEFNAHSEAQYVCDPSDRGEIIPALRDYFKKEGKAL